VNGERRVGHGLALTQTKRHQSNLQPVRGELPSHCVDLRLIDYASLQPRHIAFPVAPTQYHATIDASTSSSADYLSLRVIKSYFLIESVKRGECWKSQSIKTMVKRNV
jgi:hypothetical protein